MSFDPSAHGSPAGQTGEAPRSRHGKRHRGANVAAHRGGLQERRRGGDRRTYEGKIQFPLIDCHNIYVVEDRRRLPDRRINDIVVEWVTDMDKLL